MVIYFLEEAPEVGSSIAMAQSLAKRIVYGNSARQIILKDSQYLDPIIG